MILNKNGKQKLMLPSVRTNNILKCIKWVFLAYIIYATILGTKTLVRDYALLWNNYRAPAPMPVYLPNGFVYGLDDGSARRVIADAEHQKVILADVMNVMWQGKTIYGFRSGLAGEPYYYVCTYGENCTGTQHLKESDFIALLKAKGLPEYDYERARTYNALLWEQSRTDIGQHRGDFLY